MGKRTSGDFARRKNDLYKTWDPRAVAALLPHLDPRTRFIEPCAGDGVLRDQLVAAGHSCVYAADRYPGRDDIFCMDALNASITPEMRVDCWITNPPWSRPILHPMIVHLSDQAPTWLLFDADWVHTRQARPYLPRLRTIVSVGRLKWIEGSEHDGVDNAAWYLFDKPANALPRFVGRAA